MSMSLYIVSLRTRRKERKPIITRIILYAIKSIYGQWEIEYDALYERVLWPVFFYCSFLKDKVFIE